MIFEEKGFSRYILLTDQNFTVWLLLLLETLGNICIVIICFPVNVINFKLFLAFVLNRFPTSAKKPGQKFKYLENERSF